MVNRGARTFPRNSKGIVFVDEPGDEVVVTSCPARFASYMCRSIFTAELRPPRQYCDGRVGSGIPSASVARMTAICNAGAASRHVTGMSESDEVQMITEDRWTEAVIGSAALLTDADLKAMNLTAGFDDLWASVLALGSADLTRPALPRQLWSGRSKRVRRAVAASTALAGLIVAAGGTAAATGVSVRSAGGALTGLFGKPGFTENDTSETVNLSAPDFPSVARQVALLVITNLVRLGGLTGLTGVQEDFVGEASCTWELSWLDAHSHGDESAMHTLSTGMHRNADLPAIAHTNAAKDFKNLAADATRGEAGPIQLDAIANCTSVAQ
jgi:hypothetical protein